MTATSTDAVRLHVREQPLTRTQSEIWTGQRLAPTIPLANMGKVHRIAGALDPHRFVDAFDTVVRSSDALRTVIVDRPGQPAVARQLAEPPASTAVFDLPLAELEEWCRRRIATPVDATESGYDSVLLRHDTDDWTWWLDLHHVITDAWSSSLVFDVTSETYLELGTGHPTNEDRPVARLVPWVDHLDATRRSDDEARRAARRTFWLGQADDGGSPVAPYGPRGPRTTHVTRQPVPVPPAIDAAVDGPYRTLSRELALLGVLATATAVALHRLDGRDVVTLGVPLHHRSGRSAPNVIGPLMELYPLRVECAADDTFAMLAKRVNRGILSVMRHGKPDEGPESSYDTIVNVLTARYGDFAGFPTTTEWMRSGHVEASHPIRVQAYDYGDGLQLELDLNDSLSTDGSHAALPRHLGRCLAVATEAPDTGIGAFDLTDAADRAVLDALNPHRWPDPADVPVSIHQRITARLREDPERVVAEAGDVQLRGRDLDERAEGLARWMSSRGIGRGSRIGLRMARGLDVLVAVHGILRSGAAFVLLDPADPAARHDLIRTDADLAILLDRLPDDVGVADGPAPDAEPVAPDDLAYVLYTSGSTGAPKGVPVTHRGLASYFDAALQDYAIDGEVVMPLFSSLAYDLTITSLFLPQLAGGRTIVIGGDPVAALAGVAADQRFSVLKATPSQLELLHRLADGPLPFEVVIVGGEAFRRPLAESLATRCPPSVRIYNEYGPTETVVACMVHRWDPARDLGPDVPIGRASAGAEVFVLDRYGRPTPPGAWGELYVRRAGMSGSYLNRPDETARRFVAVDGVDAGVLYRTGDRVRVEDGSVVYAGRTDDQLSIGGVRLEPGEIEAALVRHDGVANAVVRVWSPGAGAVERCGRCGLGSDVPDVRVEDGLCSVCREFDRIEPQTRAWFRTPADLDEIRRRSRRRASGDIDCIHLLSGGKDSTYALYQLVEQGWRVHAVTLDNGYIAAGAKDNIRRTVDDLGITHEFMTTEAMGEIFRDSLDRYANVCNGCYKTIYTMATARAHAMGVPVIVTGLSRGQFFETRLIPHQFEAGRFDPDAIDRTVLEARRAYHRTSDAVTELLQDQQIFERLDVDVLSEVEFVDFYRYVDVELAEVYRFLASRAPWVRPRDTGRSTNCLVNAAGIHVHRTERGYHNYALPYSWDVRLGHKTRDEALEELDDQLDADDVHRMLDEIGYTPKPPAVLTAWYRSVDGEAIDPRVLAAHLRELLPARAVPSAFVHVDELPLADSTKLDVAALPAPGRVHTGSGDYVAPATPIEVELADLWSTILEVDRVGRHDDFFDLGGASLSALEVVAAAERRFATDLPDTLVFRHRTLGEFAAAVDVERRGGRATDALPELADGSAPLSSGESSMLFEYRAAPRDTRYNVTRLYTIDGPLDAERLGRALARVVERHGPLHTAFDEQRTVLPVSTALSIEALPAVPVEDFADAQRRVPFDLDAGPLVRVHLGETGSGRWHVLIAMHHIMVDAGTFDTFWDEVDRAYHGQDLPALPATYAQFGVWQQDRAAGDAGFWRDRIRREPLVAGVRLPPPAAAEPDGYVEIPAPVGTSELAAASSTTPFAASLAAASIVLRAYSRSDAVEIGITASTKSHPAAEPLVGYFLNSLPMVLEVDRADVLQSVETRASAAVAEVLPHRTYPFAEIVRDARAAAGRVPDISHMLAYEQLAPVRFGDRAADHRILASGTSVSDLTFFVQERGEQLRLGVEHRGAVVDAEMARHLLHRFAAVLEALCRAPHRAVDELLSADLLDDLRGPALETAPSTVVHRILEQARRTPAAPAVLGPTGIPLSYAELVERARMLAAELHRRGRPSRVGVALARSSTLVEAIIGVQLAGAAYVPIDPSGPAARHAAIIELAGVDHVVVDAGTASLVPEVERIEIDALEAPPIALDELPSPDDPAYVIFTSGSTGTPAGIEVTHANLDASTSARRQFYGDGPPERFLLTPSIGFDSSMVGLFWPLTTGGTVVVPDDGDAHDVDRLATVIATRRVTHLLMVPSLYRALLSRRAGLLTSVRTAIVAGEACPAAVVGEHHRLLPRTELVDEYGPSEATVWATAHRCLPGDDPVPIGVPIAGTTARVADEGQRPLAPGAAGELLVSGPGVVAGYLSGRSDVAFVIADGRRWYRTGDLVAVDRQQRLLFVGRVDDQLNVGGVRVEPAEVEALLTAIEGIDDAVVVPAGAGGRASLVAHVVGDERLANDRVLRARLAEQTAAVPHRIVFQRALPRTPNGKLDRARAATLPLAVATDEAPAGGSDAVVDIWRRVLGRDDLGPDDDFFEAGGDSVAAAEVVTLLGELVGHDVPVATLLLSPTPSAMVRRFSLAEDPADPGWDEPTVRLLTMRRGAPGAPAMLVVPAWYDVHSYRALIDALPADVPVAALAVADLGRADSSDLYEVDPLVDASMGLARTWADEHGARGLAIVGWSIGGVVAFELGNRLERLGTRVDRIALIDTYFPGEHRRLWSNRWWKYKSMLRPGSYGAALAELRKMLRRRLQRHAARAGRGLLRWSGQPAPPPPTVERTGDGIPVAALDHELEPGSVPVVLYAATTTNPARTEHPWRSVATDLRVVRIQGRHRGRDSIMDAGRVEQIADDLMSTFDGAGTL